MVWFANADACLRPCGLFAALAVASLRMRLAFVGASLARPDARRRAQAWARSCRIAFVPSPNFWHGRALVRLAKRIVALVGHAWRDWLRCVAGHGRALRGAWARSDAAEIGTNRKRAPMLGARPCVALVIAFRTMRIGNRFVHAPLALSCMCIRSIRTRMPGMFRK